MRAISTRVFPPIPMRSRLSARTPARFSHAVQLLTVPRKARMIWVYRCLDLPDWLRVRAGNPPTSVRGFFERFFSGMSTFMASAETAAAASRWHIIDADGQVLGRIATVAARLLQGKNKPTYTPFIDTGDHVVIVNAKKVKLTGRKEDEKIYRQHSGYAAG